MFIALYLIHTLLPVSLSPPPHVISRTEEHIGIYYRSPFINLCSSAFHRLPFLPFARVPCSCGRQRRRRRRMHRGRPHRAAGTGRPPFGHSSGGPLNNSRLTPTLRLLHPAPRPSLPCLRVTSPSLAAPRLASPRFTSPRFASPPQPKLFFSVSLDLSLIPPACGCGAGACG